MKIAHEVVALLLVACTLVACGRERVPSTKSSDGVPQSKVQADTIYVDGIGFVTKTELYDRYMNRKYGRGRRGYRYAKAILTTGDPGSVDSLIAFVNRYPGAQYYTVKALTEERTPELGPWLRQHAAELDIAFWAEIGSTLAHSGWRDSVVADVLMQQVLTTNDQNVRSAATRAFVGMGTLEEVHTLAAVDDTTSSEWVRQATTAAIARFDVPAFNERVRTALRDTILLHTRILEGLEENHRHDFLPELREVRNTLDGKRPDYFLSYLDDLIAELEEKKEASVRPGAPLDYPNSTRADSTSKQ